MQKKKVRWTKSAVVEELNLSWNHTPELLDFYFGPVEEVNQTREEQTRCCFGKYVKFIPLRWLPAFTQTVSVQLAVCGFATLAVTELGLWPTPQGRKLSHFYYNVLRPVEMLPLTETDTTSPYLRC